MDALSDKFWRRSFLAVQGKVAEKIEVNIDYVGVFRVTSGVLDLWENYAMGLFSPSGELLYVSPSPVYKSCDGEYHQAVLLWDAYKEVLNADLLIHVREQLMHWIEKNEVEICCEVFHCNRKENALIKKMKSTCNDSQIGIALLTVVVILFGVLRAREKIEYRFEHNFNTRLVSEIINAGYITPYEQMRSHALQFIEYMTLGSRLARDCEITLLGTKLIPIPKNVNSQINMNSQPWLEMNILYLIKWLKFDGFLVNAPTIYDSNIICGNKSLFMNQSVRKLYDEEKTSNKVLLLVMEDFQSRPTEFILKNFELHAEIYAAMQPEMDEFDFILFNWIFTLNLIHTHLNIVHLDLHLNNTMIGRNLIYNLLVKNSVLVKDAFMEWKIGTDLVLYTPIIKSTGYIADFSRAVDLDRFELSYPSLQRVIVGIENLTRREVEIIAKFYDYETLLTIFIDGIRSTIYKKKPFINFLPKKFAEKILNMRRYVENRKKMFLAGELPEDYIPGLDILKEFFLNFSHKHPRFKKYKFTFTTEITPTQKKELAKYKKKVYKGTFIPHIEFDK